MRWKFLFFLLLFISVKSTILFAQSTKRDFISTELGFGSMLIPENPKLLNDFISSIDLSYARSMQNKNDEWIKKLHVSYQLATLTYMNQKDLDGMLDTSANAFGDVYMFTYSLMINILGKQKNHLYLIPGWGVAYDTKTFYEDYKNIYIGSHFNYAIRLESMFTSEISSKLLLMTGIKYMHYSNGSFILPNRGINSVSYKIGLAYQFTK